MKRAVGGVSVVSQQKEEVAQVCEHRARVRANRHSTAQQQQHGREALDKVPFEMMPCGQGSQGSRAERDPGAAGS